MDLGNEEEPNWETNIDKAREFVGGFRLKTAVVAEEKRPFYQSLLDLVESAINRDEDYLRQTHTLPEEERALKGYGDFMSYRPYGEGTDDETRFLTSRSGWTNRDIGPSLEGHKTPTGGFIKISPTFDAASRFDRQLFTESNLSFVKVYADGRIEGFSGSIPHELSSEETAALTRVFDESKNEVQRRHATLRKQMP